MAAKRLPRLTRREVEELRRAAELLTQSGRALHQSSWQGAPAVGAIVADVYQLVASLYNRAEPSYLASIGGQPAQPTQDAAPAAAPAAEEARDPGLPPRKPVSD